MASIWCFASAFTGTGGTLMEFSKTTVNYCRFCCIVSAFFNLLVYLHYCSEVTQQYLCDKLLVLLRQDPGTGIEVVLLGEQLLHSPDCSTHVDLPQHFNHSCNPQKHVQSTEM